MPSKKASDIKKWFISIKSQSDVCEHCFGIIFNGPENITKPPSNFSYTIRWMNNYVETDSLFPQMEKTDSNPLEAGGMLT